MNHKALTEETVRKHWYRRNPEHEINADTEKDMFFGTVVCVFQDILTEILSHANREDEMINQLTDLDGTPMPPVDHARKVINDYSNQLQEHFYDDLCKFGFLKREHGTHATFCNLLNDRKVIFMKIYSADLELAENRAKENNPNP